MFQTNMAPDHKAIALRHLIKAFDLAEPNTYATTAERRALCDGLLAEHDLMDPNPQGNRQALTQDRYMSMLRQAIYDGGTNVKAFCRDGSKSMRAVYLEKIGYTPPPLAEGQNADTAPEAKTLAAAQQPGAQSGSELDQGHPGQDQADRRPSTKIHLKKPNQKQEQMPVSPPDKATGIGPFKRRSHATGAKRTLEEVESGGEEQDVARSPKKLRLEVASTGEKPAHDGTRNHPEDAAGKKRNRVIVDSEDDDAVRPAKSQRVGAAPTAPSQASSSKAASDQGLADGNGIGGKRKRDNLEEESVASARPTKSSRPTSSGSATADRVNIGGRPKPVSVSSEKQHSNRTANRAEHQGGTARAAVLDFTSASLNKQTAGPSIHDRDLVEDDDGQPIHPLFAKHNIPYSQWKKARQAEGAPSVYTLEPQERNIALGAEDPLGPVGHRHLEPLSSDAIERHLDTVWRRIEKFAINLLGQESLLEPPLAKFVANPGPELAELYQTMLGPDWRKQAAVMNMTGKLSQYNIIEGCMAAAVHQYVYEKPAKWQTPRSMLEELHSQHQLEGFNAFFKFMTDPDRKHLPHPHKTRRHD